MGYQSLWHTSDFLEDEFLEVQRKDRRYLRFKVAATYCQRIYFHLFSHQSITVLACVYLIYFF